MAIYLSMFIEDKTAVDIPDNITTSFKITPKRNKQLPFPVILISKSAVNIELTLHPIVNAHGEDCDEKAREVLP